MANAYYVNDLALLANSPGKAEYQLKSQEQAAGDIGLYMNAHKQSSYVLKKEEPSPVLEARSLKLVKKFTNLGSNTSSTEREVNIRIFSKL